jgi:hypothetical protein
MEGPGEFFTKGNASAGSGSTAEITPFTLISDGNQVIF